MSDGHPTARAHEIAESFPVLRWAAIAAERADRGGLWPTGCPLCRRPFDGDLRWQAEHRRLVRLPDGCAAHRYCAVEDPRRDLGRIAGHDHGHGNGNGHQGQDPWRPADPARTAALHPGPAAPPRRLRVIAGGLRAEPRHRPAA